MNTTSTRRPAAVLALVWVCLAALFGFVGAGCSDHGPVNVFAPELFHRQLGGPLMSFYSAANVSFTTQAPQSGCNVCYSGPPSVLDGGELVVTLANTGGAGTYGPILATFTSPDCHVVWDGNSTLGNWVNPSSTSANFGTSVSTFGAGNEILPFDQTSVLMYQGYDNNGDLVDDTQLFSAAFYYTPNGCYANQQIAVPVNLTITDGLGNTYTSIFYLYIIQSNGLGAGPCTTACPAL